MANRSFSEDYLTVIKRPITIWGVFLMSSTTPVLRRWQYGTLGSAPSYTNAATTGGGSGFPNRYAQGAEGIYSVARTGTGLWTVTFQDRYSRLLGLSVHQSFAGGAGTIMSIHENTTISDYTVAGTIVGVGLRSATGTFADPADTTVVRIRFDLQDASEA